MVWEGALHRWNVQTDRGDTIISRFVLQANGQFAMPKLPAVVGLDRFKGKAFHAVGKQMSNVNDPMLEHLSNNMPTDVYEVRRLMDRFFLDFVKKAKRRDCEKQTKNIQYGKHTANLSSISVFQPSANEQLPSLIYIHGGGYVMGSSETYEQVLCRLANTGFVVFSVDYRLAPEFPFPDGFHDCVNAVSWIQNNAKKFSGDPDRLVLVGDSAGGNLAAGVSAHLTQNGLAKVIALGLAYPTLVPPEPELWSGLGVVPKLLLDAYLPSSNYETLFSDPRFNPILGAEYMPPTVLVCGTGDLLIADCRRLANELRSNGTQAEEYYFQGMPHGFIQMESLFEDAGRAIERIATFLHAELLNNRV